VSWEAPPEASESITSEPESDEVTKKVMISTTVMKDTMPVSGSRSYSLNSAIARVGLDLVDQRGIALDHDQVQRGVAEDREPQKGEDRGYQHHAEHELPDRAAAADLGDEQPTNGAQAMVQPKMNSVQLPIQSLRE
jgi:hypothetical protein